MNKKKLFNIIEFLNFKPDEGRSLYYQVDTHDIKIYKLDLS